MELRVSAVVIGITVLSEKHDTAQFDEISAEAVRIASDAVAWKAKPSTYGGGQGAAYLTGLSFAKIGHDATNKKGTAAHTKLYWRNMRAVTSKRPYFTVRPKAKPDIRVQLFMYGPTADCFKMRRGRKIDGKWVNAKMKVGKNKSPAGCKPW